MHVDRRLLGWGLFFVLLGAIPLAIRAGLLDKVVVSQWPLLWPVLLIELNNLGDRLWVPVAGLVGKLVDRKLDLGNLSGLAIDLGRDLGTKGLINDGREVLGTLRPPLPELIGWLEFRLLGRLGKSETVEGFFHGGGTIGGSGARASPIG